MAKKKLKPREQVRPVWPPLLAKSNGKRRAEFFGLVQEGKEGEVSNLGADRGMTLPVAKRKASTPIDAGRKSKDEGKKYRGWRFSCRGLPGRRSKKTGRRAVVKC